MAESGSVFDALKILSEVGFGGAQPEDPGDFESLLKNETESLYAFIKETCPKDNVIKYLLLDSDYSNAEAIIKEKHLKIDSAPMLSPNGTYTAEFLREKIMADDYGSFPKTLGEALILCDEAFVSGNYDGLKINAIFERAKFKEMRALSKKEKTLKELFRVKADTANVTVALRGRNYSLFKDYFIEGGTLSDDDLKHLSEDSFDAIRERFSTSSLKEYIFSAVDDAEKGKPLTEFEKKADDFSLVFLSKYKYMFEGIAPYLLYVYYKLAEILNVRLILVCLSNGVSAENIKRRLRVSYAG